MLPAFGWQAVLTRWEFAPVVTAASGLAMYATIDGDAHIRARISFDLGDPRNLHWCSASMVDMFAQDHVCEPGAAQLSYDELSAAFREALYVANLTRPLPADHAKRKSDYAS